MIVVDTSAIIAVLFDEKEAVEFANVIAREDEVVIGAPTALECDMVLRSRIGSNGPSIDSAFQQLEITVVDFTEAHYLEAKWAYDRFGKGRHPAGLNFGDCLAYGVAKTLNAPLLFKGNDFSQTDIVAAIWPH